MYEKQAAEALKIAAPIAMQPYTPIGKVGLVIVDEINGFCTVGMGPLAPAAPNPQVDRMISETDRLARVFIENGWPIYVFLDTHVPGRAEPPYPPHCEIGTGQEELVPALKWLETVEGANVTFLKKDVINGLVGAIQPDGSNALFDWIVENELTGVAFVGICTDICVADVVLTMLSARNHYLATHDDPRQHTPMLPTLKDIVVYEPGCATYHLPIETVNALGLPATAAHDQDLFHHMGLSIMQSRGAIIASEIA